jgi:Cu/Ag efflux protein CusF
MLWNHPARSNQEKSRMNKVQRICFTALCSIGLATAVLAVPNRHQAPQTPSQSAAQLQSVSGKIASVDKSSFTLTVGASTTQKMEMVQTPSASPKTMTFQVDKNTTVEGKLKVNATADVTYREESGNNIAVSVRVTP